MILRAIPLDFLTNFDRSGAVAMYKDKLIGNLAERFSEEEFIGKPNLAHGYAKVWAAVEFNAAEQPQAVQGLIGYQNTPDITLVRATTPQAMIVLTKRISAFFSDNGLRGMPILVHANPNEEPRYRCPKLDESLKAWKAEPANRFSVVVR